MSTVKNSSSQNSTDLPSLCSLPKGLSLAQGQQSLLEQAQRYLDNRNNYALSCFEALYKMDPQSPEVVIGLAESYDLFRDYDKAYEYAGKVLELPNMSNTLKARVGVVKANYWFQGHQDPDQLKAIASLTEALTLDPASAAAYRLLGYIYGYQANQGLRDAAWNNGIVQAQKINNKAGLARLYLCKTNIYYDQLDFKSALLEVEKAKEQNPDQVGIYNFSASIYAEMGDVHQAKINLEKFSSMVPKDSNFYGTSFFICYALRDYQQALEDYQHALSLPPVPLGPAYNTLSTAYLSVHNYAEALKAVQKAAQMDKTDTTPCIQEAWVYYKMKEYEQSLVSLNGLKKVIPEGWSQNQCYYSNLAAIYYAQANDVRPEDSQKKDGLLALAKEALLMAIKLDTNGEDRSLAEFKFFYLDDKEAGPVALDFYQKSHEANLSNDRAETIAKIQEKIKNNQVAQ